MARRIQRQDPQQFVGVKTEVIVRAWRQKDSCNGTRPRIKEKRPSSRRITLLQHEVAPIGCDLRQLSITTSQTATRAVPSSAGRWADRRRLAFLSAQKPRQRSFTLAGTLVYLKLRNYPDSGERRVFLGLLGVLLLLIAFPRPLTRDDFRRRAFRPSTSRAATEN